MLPFEKSKTQHYNFAHIAIPILALMNPSKFYQDMTSPNGEKYLHSIWHGLAEKMVIPRHPSFGLGFSIHHLSGNIEAIIIKLPQPKDIAEAFYVAAVYKFKDNSTRKEIENGRYFTLELGKNPFNESTEYHFCEWEGNIISAHQHKNYGRLSENSLNKFKSAICEVLGIDEISSKKEEMSNPSSPSKVVPARNSIDDMSETEKLQFVVDKLLPTMEEIALEELAKNEKVMEDTMAYVDQAIKDRKRSTLIQQILIAIVALAVGACVTFVCVAVLYFLSLQN